MYNLLFIMQEVIPAQSIIASQFEKLTNPILGILLLVLGGAIWFLMKQNSAKDKYIKELNVSLLEHSVKSLDVTKNLENAMKTDTAAHGILREILKENNLLLQKIINTISKQN